MAISWSAKAPTAVLEYPWTPLPDTPLDSATPVVTTGTATITADVAGDTVTFTVTGGAAGVVQVFTVTATSGDQTLVETFYLPIETSVNRLGYTARDVCIYALRKIVGIAEEPDADQLADALERLNDMLAMWRDTGADLGLPLPLVEASPLNVNDAYYAAIKANLRNAVQDFYGMALTASEAIEARHGLATVKNGMIVHRKPLYY
jgi:hypothetical protein